MVWPSALSAVVILLLTTARGASATTIVVFRSNTEIIIAADSMTGGGTGSTCKVRVYDDVVLAAAGTIEAANPQMGVSFSLYDVAAQWLTGPAQAPERINRFRRNAVNAFLEVLNAHTVFELLAAAPTLSFVVALVEDGIPVVVDHRYRMELRMDPPRRPSGTLSEVAEPCGLECATRWFFYGVADTLDALEARGEIAALEQRLGPADVAAELVRRQMRAAPDLVGGAIDVLRLSRDGIEWIARKPECDEREGE